MVLLRGEQMDKGIADRLMFFMSPESPLRSDRVLGLVAAAGTIFASIQGVPADGVIGLFTNTWTEMLSGFSGFTSLLAVFV